MTINNIIITIINSIMPSSQLCDFPERWEYGFQDPGSPWMFALVDLNERITFYQIIILSVVLWFMIRTISFSPVKNQPLIHNTHGNTLEQGWTITPALILWAIGLPSLKLQYLMDEILEAEITVKANGSQWYWSAPFNNIRDWGNKSPKLLN